MTLNGHVKCLMLLTVDYYAGFYSRTIGSPFVNLELVEPLVNLLQGSQVKVSFIN